MLKASMFWRNKKPKPERKEPYISFPKILDFSDEEVRLLLKLSRVKWPDNDKLTDFILEDEALMSPSCKYNFLLAALGKLTSSEMAKRDFMRIIDKHGTHSS